MWLVWVHLLTVMHTVLAYNGVAIEFDPALWMHQMPPSRVNASGLKLQNLERALGFANCSTRAKYHDRIVNTLVVLPEYGLTGPTFPTRESVRPFLESVPEPAAMTILCNDSSWGAASPALTLASCLAYRCGIDLVLDLAEGETCNSEDEACPSDGVWQYNTQVALRGLDGALVGRYRKEHLYYEPAFNQPFNQSAQTFVSSLGVKFGMMICFDIMFDWPASALLDDGVKDVVYSTWWVNKPPLLTGTQVQAGWANASRVNLIAAGSGEEGWRSSGSGVYPFGGRDTSGAVQWVSAASLAPEAGVAVREMSTTVTPPAIESDSRPFSTSVDTADQQSKKDDEAQLATLPWHLNVSTIPHGLSEWQSSTQHVNCTVEAVPTSMAGNLSTDSFAVVAAEGWYNGLFPTVMCGIMACPTGNSSCFIEDGTRFGAGAFQYVHTLLTVCNDTEQPAERWKLFNNAAHGHMEAILPSHGFGMTGWQMQGTRCATASSSLAKPVDDLLAVLLYGIDRKHHPTQTAGDQDG